MSNFIVFFVCSKKILLPSTLKLLASKFYDPSNAFRIFIIMSEFGNNLNIICFESEAFYALIEEVVARIKDQKSITQHDKWISDKEAMQMLRISSRTTLQRLRDEGLIRFSQPTRKLILYDRDSILKYLETHAKDVF